MKVENGKVVVVEYEGKFEDGTIFDASSKHGQPLMFQVGAHHVVKGFEEAVVGMQVGEEKEVTLQPEDAYGPVNPQLQKKVPREHLPKDQEPKVDMMLMVGLPTGQQLPARIVAVDEKEVTLDLNHPLAGKVLIFKLKLLEIKDAPAVEEKEEKKE